MVVTRAGIAGDFMAAKLDCVMLKETLFIQCAIVPCKSEVHSTVTMSHVEVFSTRPQKRVIFFNWP